MNTEEVVSYWLDTAKRDFKTMEHLFASRDYHWALFMGHLVLEKLFKALYVRRIGGVPPRIHDLARLAERCKLEMDEATLAQLSMISRFNLNVRYPDYQREVYKICTRSYSMKVMKSIKELRSWLERLILQP